MVTVTHSVVAQVPIAGVASLSCDPSESAEDVAPLLTQVHNLGSFKAGDLAVSGTRKVAAIVSWQGRSGRGEREGEGRELTRLILYWSTHSLHSLHPSLLPLCSLLPLPPPRGLHCVLMLMVVMLL